MVKRLLALILFCSSAFATTTITGNLKNLGGGSISFGTFVRFYLRGCSGNQPRINGTAIIGPTLGNIYYIDLVPTAAGLISGTVYSTTDATGTGNGDIECGGIKTGLWYGMVPFINGKSGVETPIAAKNTATIDISNVTPLSANPVVLSPTGDTTYARLDGGNQPFTGPITVGTTFKAGDGFNAINVLAKGMVADCVPSGNICTPGTDNTTALNAIITYACGISSTNPPAIEFPVNASGNWYYWNSNVSIGCDGLTFRGAGLPNIYCPNGCFTNSGHRNIEMYRLRFVGNNVASTYAISHTTNVASALNVHYHDIVIQNFGTTGGAACTGGAVNVASDSAEFRLDHSYLANECVNVLISAPTDTADISENFMGNQSASVGTRCLDATGGSGANTIKYAHNNMQCEGLGALRINVSAGVTYLLYDNETETSQTIVNASNASWELLAGTFLARGNTVNPHSATGATYAFFVGNSAGSSSHFFDNTPSGYNTAGYFIGTATGLIFGPDVVTAGYNTLYSADYIGIILPGLPGGAGNAWGCSNPTMTTGNEFCNPVEVFSSGTASTTALTNFAPNLANGNSVVVRMGTAFSTNNALELAFNNVGGAASASNTATLGITNGTAVTITPTGQLTAPGNLLAGASGTGLVQTGTIQNGGHSPVTVPGITGAANFLTSNTGDPKIQECSVATGGATGNVAGNVHSDTCTWATAFADATYTAVCQGLTVTSGTPVISAITSQLAASVAVNTMTVTAVASQFTTIKCIGIHN